MSHLNNSSDFFSIAPLEARTILLRTLRTPKLYQRAAVIHYDREAITDGVESFWETHPEEMPDRFEPNVLG